MPSARRPLTHDDLGDLFEDRVAGGGDEGASPRTCRPGRRRTRASESAIHRIVVDEVVGDGCRIISASPFLHPSTTSQATPACPRLVAPVHVPPSEMSRAPCSASRILLCLHAVGQRRCTGLTDADGEGVAGARGRVAAREPTVRDRRASNEGRRQHAPPAVPRPTTRARRRRHERSSPDDLGRRRLPARARGDARGARRDRHRGALRAGRRDLRRGRRAGRRHARAHPGEAGRRRPRRARRATGRSSRAAATPSRSCSTPATPTAAPARTCSTSATRTRASAAASAAPTSRAWRRSARSCPTSTS